jgi:DNA-binding NarL/FixJ family response regulator
LILIAEDNLNMRRVIRSLVEDIDTNIVECVDGQQAVDAYYRLRPDWVLIDINMRPMDGLSALKAIVSRYPDARVVIVSQHQDASTVERAMALGACAFVGKDDLSSLPAVMTRGRTARP